MLALGGAGRAADPAAAPTTSEDFIKALKPAAAVDAPSDAPLIGQKPKTRGLALGTADTAAPAAPAPAPTRPQAAPRISFQVEFAFNSADLTPKASGILNELGRALTSPELSAYSFQLTGHTDGVGGADYNLALSKRRAAAVRDYLTRTFAVAPDRLKSRGLGSQQLLDPANPASDVNRRVEIVNLGS
ncbi:OmpA family protein [Azospirillum sp. HJ39]|uniref:OmpA family protein n=1 Tax=Azospirillum sp. HJ39 TaxID=3159496 RepID=UPI003558349C